MKVRQAFQHGIDRDEILSTVYTEDWSPAESLIQSNVPEATDHSDDVRLRPRAGRVPARRGGLDQGRRRRPHQGRQAARAHALPQPVPGHVQGDRRARRPAARQARLRVDIQAYDVVTFGERVSDEHVAVQLRGHAQLHRRRHGRQHPHRRRQRRGLVRPRRERPEDSTSCATPWRRPPTWRARNEPLDELQELPPASRATSSRAPRSCSASTCSPRSCTTSPTTASPTPATTRPGSRTDGRGADRHERALPALSPAGAWPRRVVVVLLAYVFTFVVISVLPGDPSPTPCATPQNGFTEEEIQRIVAYYGLDQPCPSSSGRRCPTSCPATSASRCGPTCPSRPADRRGAARPRWSSRSAPGGRAGRWPSRSPTAPSSCRGGSGRACCGLPVAVPVGAELRDRPAADPALRVPARASSA